MINNISRQTEIKKCTSDFIKEIEKKQNFKNLLDERVSIPEMPKDERVSIPEMPKDERILTQELLALGSFKLDPKKDTFAFLLKLNEQ